MAGVADALTALQKAAASSTTSRFNTEIVRSAWSLMQRQRRQALRNSPSVEPDSDPFQFCYIRQVWTDHIIVELDSDTATAGFLRIPYTVKAPGASVSDVSFGSPEPVMQTYVTALSERMSGALSRVESRGKAGADAASVVALAIVRTQAGANRYQVPIGSQIPTGQQSEQKAATGKSTPGPPGQQQSVIGNIKDKSDLSRAFSALQSLTGIRQGYAAVEVVLAAQELGLTAMVPASVKRLYRRYLAYATPRQPQGSK